MISWRSLVRVQYRPPPAGAFGTLNVLLDSGHRVIAHPLEAHCRVAPQAVCVPYAAPPRGSVQPSHGVPVIRCCLVAGVFPACSSENWPPGTALSVVFSACLRHRPTQWPCSGGEQVAEAQAVGQLQQGFPVLMVGPDPAFSPTPYGVAIGLQAAGDLRPRRARLFLEPLEPLREVVGEDLGSSPGMCALSRHGASAPRAQP